MFAFNFHNLLKYLGVSKFLGSSNMTESDSPTFCPLITGSQLQDDCNESTEVELENGLCLNNIYMPEEVILQILSYVEPKYILQYSLVCRNWNKLIKSYALWSTIYKRRRNNRKPKKLPWYVYYCLFSSNYFDTNLIKNGNGELNYDFWELIRNDGDKFNIEDLPQGSDPLPLDVAEFHNKTSCFATSYEMCCKRQTVSFANNKLFKYIINCYKPHIYLSEWTSARFDCGSVYKLACIFRKNLSDLDVTELPCAINYVEQWAGKAWSKMELTVTDYPDDIDELVLEHEGRDTQFWSGHYGSKMAGAVMKVLFDSIEALPTDEEGKEIPKKYTKIEFTNNGLSKERIEQIQNYFHRRLPYYEIDFDEFEQNDYDDDDEVYPF